jgi:hypothetical protein
MDKEDFVALLQVVLRAVRRSNYDQRDGYEEALRQIRQAIAAVEAL